MQRTGLLTGLLWVAVAAIAICGCSTERTKPPSSEQPAGAVGTGGAGANLSNDDFVRDVTLKNMAEVELSRLALDKTTNLDIKAFAQRMIDDHGAAGNHLKAFCQGSQSNGRCSSTTTTGRWSTG